MALCRLSSNGSSVVRWEEDERTSLVEDEGEWVVSKVCRWRALGPTLLTVPVSLMG